MRIVSFLLSLGLFVSISAKGETQILEKTACFATFGGSLIDLQNLESSKSHRLLRTKPIQGHEVEVFLMTYGKIVEARLSVLGPNYQKYEARGYLMPGPYDGVNLSAQGFYVSCIYERSEEE